METYLPKAVTQAELARQIGVPYYMVRYAHRVGRLPMPEQSAPGCLLYSSAEAAAVREYFKMNPPQHRKPRGFTFNQEVCDE